MITIGSCFSGIGGFELGLESAIPNSKTIWQIEQDQFCQQILKKHWPHAHIHGDIKNATEQNLERPDILCAGFPCQDISVAGKGEGIINGTRSSLFFDMWQLCLQLRPSIIILENVPALYNRGLGEVLRTVAESGIYDCEWGYLEAQYFGAPHKRRRIFIVCYLTNTDNTGRKEQRKPEPVQKKQPPVECGCSSAKISLGNGREIFRVSQEVFQRKQSRLFGAADRKIWAEWTEEPALIPKVCRVDDGIPARLDRDRRKRLKALGNAIVPQCSAWIGHRLMLTGKLEGLR